MAIDEVQEIIERADDTLRAAFMGLDMMNSASGKTKKLGLRNVLTFARSVTFVLQNLSGKDPRFESWYSPHQEAMKHDQVFCFFRDARNNLEKQGRLETKHSTNVHFFGSEVMAQFEKQRPPGAESFFIGDNLGGSGWEIKLPSGEKEKFYVNMPEEIATVELQFSGHLAEKYLESNDQTVVEHSKYVLNRLSLLVDDARLFFLGQPAPQLLNGRRLPAFIKVVK